MDDDDNESTEIAGTFTIRDPTEFHSLTFSGPEGKVYLTLTADGKLVLGEDLSRDEATQLTAKMLAEHYGEQMAKYHKKDTGNGSGESAI